MREEEEGGVFLTYAINIIKSLEKSRNSVNWRKLVFCGMMDCV